MSKRVLVTGASRGIGKAIAIELAKNDFHVVINYRDNSTAAKETLQTIKENKGTASLLPFDISDRSVCEHEIKQDMNENGVYYGVVCNAGISADASFPELSGDAWDSVIHTNLDGFYNVLKPIVLPMVQTRKSCRIVSLSSVSGITGNRGQVNYSAAKAGIIGATKALSQELAKRKISVNCVAPGLIETNMIKDLHVSDYIKHIPMRRLGKPEEVAALVNFLFSTQAEYITGQVISINGGMI
jgi:3-oxoacyl-[acyl-carrier protein] reductase